MTLQAKLNEISAGFAKQVTPEQKEIMARSAQALADTKPTEKVLKKGDQLPAFSLKDSGGQERPLTEFTGSGPVVISFFRGFW